MDNPYETVLQTNAGTCTCTICLVNGEGILAEERFLEYDTHATRC